MIIRKKSGKIIQKGTITRYNKDREYYWIDYKNGNSENNGIVTSQQIQFLRPRTRHNEKTTKTNEETT